MREQGTKVVTGGKRVNGRFIMEITGFRDLFQNMSSDM